MRARANRRSGADREPTPSGWERLLRVPPLRQMALGVPRLRRVVGRVVVKHETGPHGVLEVEDVEARGRLIEPVAVAASVDAEEARQKQPDGCLVRDHRHGLVRMTHDDRPHHRQRSGHHREPGLAALRREGERVLLPVRVLVRELGLDFLSRATLPAPVRDLAEPRIDGWLHPPRARDERRSLTRPLHGRRIDCVERELGETLAEHSRLAPAFFGEVDVGRAGESVLGREHSSAVAYEQDARCHCRES